ncbi:MAG: hypothetical protein LBM41_02375 [Ruminococcus sp.]|jgi:hypothetical protein|nr:hypothetical protein [Ruminococcus sp.]
MDMNSGNIEKRSLVRPDLTPDEYANWVKKKKAWEELQELMKIPPIFTFPEDDPDYKKAREIIYRERGLIP